MTKQELFDAFDQRISKKAIVNRDGENVVQGKFCVVASEGADIWDIWVCNTDDLYHGLGTKKVRNICTELKKSEGCGAVRELTGEANMRARGTAIVLNTLKVLGIRKKQEYPPEQLVKARARMKAARKSKVEVAA